MSHVIVDNNAIGYCWLVTFVTRRGYPPTPLPGTYVSVYVGCDSLCLAPSRYRYNNFETFELQNVRLKFS